MDSKKCKILDMKSFICSVAIFMMFISCRYQQHHNDSRGNDTNYLKSNQQIDTSGLYHQDSSIKISQFENEEETKFSRLKNAILDKKNIRLIDSLTFSESILTKGKDDKKHLLDSFISKNDAVVVSYYPYLDSNATIEIEHRKISFDSIHLISDTTENKIGFYEFNFSSQSIRKFAFHNKIYYYLQVQRNGGMLYNLIYDITHNTLQAFETFRGPVLYFVGDVDGDENLDFLFIRNGTQNDNDNFNHFAIYIYSLLNGKWVLLRDRANKKYFINGITKTKNDRWLLEGNSDFKIKDYYWPKKVDLKKFQ